MSIVKPLLLNIILCDYIIREENTHKLTLIGLFNSINAKKFPCAHPKFSLYISFTEFEGDADGKLRIVQEETNNVLVELKGNIKSANCLSVVELNFVMENIPLPKAGSYRIEFWIGNDLLGHRKFLAQQITD
jgi:hypothetical protein